MKKSYDTQEDQLTLEDSQTNYTTGYIKLFRSIKKHWLWKESRKKTPFEAWMDLMLRACHSDLKEPIGPDFIVVKRGQILTSQLKLSKDWMWSRKAVTFFLRALERDNMVDIKCTNKWSMITICNYATYQDFGTTKEQQKNIKRTSKEHQEHTYNELKELERIKNIYDSPFENAELNALWQQWVQHRKQKREPLTEVAAERQITKIKAHTVEQAKQSIEKSIERNWTGLFFEEDGNHKNVVKMQVKVKAVGINEDDWIIYEDGKVLPPGSYPDVSRHKKGELPLSHFDRIAS
jgi:hypothetical protein